MSSTLPPPVQVRFASLYQPDIPALSESLIPYGRWSEEHVAAHLPVAVSYPAEISQRLQVLEGYLARGGWSPNVPYGAIESVRAIVEQMMPDIEAEITRAVRLMAAAAIRDDGSRAVLARDQSLSIFLASKMLASARALQGCQLIGEPTLDWGEEFYEMATVFSARLIYGLSFLAREPHGWAGWTDADLRVDERRYRLFEPICPDLGATMNVETLSSEDVRRLIVPQLLSSDRHEQISFLTIRRVALEPWATFEPNLIRRDEVFVDTETCSDHYHAKAYITRIAVDRIVSVLQKTPLEERWRKYLELTIALGPVSHDVAARVRESISIGRR